MEQGMNIIYNTTSLGTDNVMENHLYKQISI